MGKEVMLDTGRLLIKEVSLGDFDEIHEIKSNHEVVRYLTWGPNTPDQTLASLHKQLSFQTEAPRTKYVLAVIHKESGRLIGNCLLLMREPAGTAEIGYFFHTDAWGKGFAQETAAALLDFGFHELQLQKIYATCDPANSRSARTLQRLGMKQEDYFIENNLVFSMLSDEYAKKNPICI